jgi:hypothetical protein
MTLTHNEKLGIEDEIALTTRREPHVISTIELSQVAAVQAELCISHMSLQKRAGITHVTV